MQVTIRRACPTNNEALARRASLFIRRLAVTYFRAIYLALSSALRRFTVLFGMGRRGSTSLWPPSKAAVRQPCGLPNQFGRSCLLWI
jgi:hypothetical protein